MLDHPTNGDSIVLWRMMRKAEQSRLSSVEAGLLSAENSISGGGRHRDLAAERRAYRKRALEKVAPKSLFKDVIAPPEVHLAGLVDTETRDVLW
jgi:hypothetical protein